MPFSPTYPEPYKPLGHGNLHGLESDFVPNKFQKAVWLRPSTLELRSPALSFVPTPSHLPGQLIVFVGFETLQAQSLELWMHPCLVWTPPTSICRPWASMRHCHLPKTVADGVARGMKRCKHHQLGKSGGVPTLAGGRCARWKEQGHRMRALDRKCEQVSESLLHSDLC